MKLGDKLFDKFWVWMDPNGTAQDFTANRSWLSRTVWQLERACVRLETRVGNN